MLTRLPILTGLAALLLGSAAALAAPTVTHARIQVLMASRPAAGYFTLHNDAATPLTLSGASAPDCQSLMLHQSKTTGGMATMAMVSTVVAPPGGNITFSPGGYHLMCMQPTGPLLSHHGIETVTLHFADGTSMTAPFTIQGPRP